MDQKFETWKGELFNQNENAFYLFEPLAAIQSEMSTMGCDKMIEQKIKYVKFIKWSILYGPYRMDHIVWTISYERISSKYLKVYE